MRRGNQDSLHETSVTQCWFRAVRADAAKEMSRGSLFLLLVHLICTHAIQIKIN